MSDYASQSGHWYDRTGGPAYTIVGKNGKERATTLRDARVHQYAPGVTTITGCAARPGLEFWKGDQLILASLTLRPAADETDDQWKARIRKDAAEQATKAAERGISIHAAIEKWLRGEPVADDLMPHVEGAMAAVRLLDLDGRTPERSFVSPYGYGGKLDLLSRHYILDFKTKDGDLKDVRCYDEHFMQGAGYERGIGGGTVRREVGNVFVSRTHPGIARLVMHNREDTERGWRMFRALLHYWQAANDYRPSWAVPVEIEAA